MGIRIGDAVIDRHGEHGLVERQYDDFSACAASCESMTGDEWLAAQEIPFTESQLREPWFRVACATGGGIWSPESCLELSR